MTEFAARARLRHVLTTTALASVLAACGAGGALAQAPAATAETTRRFDIPTGPLATALAAFADATSVQLLYPSDLAQGRQTPGLRGAYTARVGLDQLLAGSGLTWRFIDGRTVQIERQASPEDGRVLGPVRVEGQTGGQYAGPPGRNEGVAQLGGVRGRQDDEAVGYRPVVATIGAGRPVAIEDVPRSVSVLTEAQIESQDIQDIGEALRRLPGVTVTDFVASGGNGAINTGTVRVRGQSINSVQIDGGAPRLLNIVHNGLLDIGSYERVELVRGPNGVFNGSAGSGGGALNLIRKRPGTAPGLGVTFQVGSFDRVGGTIDVQTPSLFGTPFAFRGVVQSQTQQFAWQNHKRDDALAYGIVDAPLGEKARFEVGGEYTQVNEDAAYFGTFRYLDGPTIRPTGSFYDSYTPPWIRREVETAEVFSRFFVDLLGSWDFDVGAAYRTFNHTSIDWISNGQNNLLSTTGELARDPTTGAPLSAIELFPRFEAQESAETFVDFKLTGQLKTWGLDHDIYVTGDLSERRGGSTTQRSGVFPQPAGASGSVSRASDYLGSNYPTPAIFRPSGGEQFSSSTSRGLTIADTIDWNDRIILNLQLRRSDSESSNGSVAFAANGPRVPFSVSASATGTNTDREADWLPSWSLVLKPLKNLSVYGSRSQGNTPQNNQFTRDGEPLGPRTFENWELGFKYSREAWLLSVSAFELVQTNIATAIPLGEPGGNPGSCPPLPTSRCFYLAGDNFESKGVDFELSGEVLPGLNAQVSYNYNDSVTISPAGRPPSVTQAPVNMGKALFDWTPKFAPAFSFRVSASYRDVIYEAGTRRIYDPVTLGQVASIPFSYKEEPHIIADIGATWRFHPDWSADLYVQNVTDEEYYSTVSAFSAYIAPPLTALLTLRWRYEGEKSWASPTTGLSPFGDPADWYGALDVGVHRPSDLEAVSRNNGPAGRPINWRFETTGSPVFVARLGYRLADHWRVEAEGAQKFAAFDRIGGGTDLPTGVCGVRNASVIDPFTGCQEPDGEADFWTFNINGFYDFGRPEARLRPFVGVGLGLTRSSIDFGGRLEGVRDTQYRERFAALNPTRPNLTGLAPGELIAADNTAVTPTWQLLGGLSWRVNAQATVEVGYRYTSVPNIEMNSTNLGTYPYAPNNSVPDLTQISSPAPSLGGFDTDFSDHAVTVGLRWAFGSR
jgi:outer membrane receptor for ferric coprogen and ferric-rhodotorulic acid